MSPAVREPRARRARSRRAGRAMRALGLVGALAAACGPAPPSYELVGLVQARELLLDPGLAVVYVLESGEESASLPQRGMHWSPRGGEPPEGEVPSDAPVLLIGPSEALAHSSAAVLARRRNQRVYVCIARSAEERSSLYARVREIEEVPGGRDS